jgi:hypothetical protein
LIETGANDVLRVVADDGTERLLPFVSAVVLAVEKEAAIRVEWGSDWCRGQQPVIRFDCVTIFPEMFVAVTQSGITRRALEEQRWVWQGWNPRDFAENAWRRVDDRPFGGGPGMLMQPGPLEKAIDAAKRSSVRQVWRRAGLSTSRRRRRLPTNG